uniref:FZ domain-containing protein n=1 Tax=Caenorhabditis japonica TaxID=281687 RepID=A0A8R1E6X0_CAEJA
MLFLFVILAFSVTNAYLEDSWAMFSSERPLGPKCVEIPSNLSICTGIEYTQMRLPNYLEHETVSEAVHASKDWESLLRLNCHPDTQRFLCSLFAPVCLMQMDRAILPCKSLCMAVKQGCENRMANYGFPWPEMLSCEKFVDDDMCIKPVQPAKETSEIRLSAESTGCPCNISTKVKNEKFVVMASRQSDGNYLANLVLPWKKDKNFKRAVHQFQRLNCQSLGREIRESASKRPHYYEMRRHNTGRYQLF